MIKAIDRPCARHTTVAYDTVTDDAVTLAQLVTSANAMREHVDFLQSIIAKMAAELEEKVEFLESVISEDRTAHRDEIEARDKKELADLRETDRSLDRVRGAAYMEPFYGARDGIRNLISAAERMSKRIAELQAEVKELGADDDEAGRALDYFRGERWFTPSSNLADMIHVLGRRIRELQAQLGGRVTLDAGTMIMTPIGILSIEEAAKMLGELTVKVQELEAEAKSHVYAGPTNDGKIVVTVQVPTVDGPRYGIVIGELEGRHPVGAIMMAAQQAATQVMEEVMRVGLGAKGVQ